MRLKYSIMTAMLSAVFSVNAQTQNQGKHAMVKLSERHTVASRFGSLPENGTIEHCTMNSDIPGVDKYFSGYLPAGYDEDNTDFFLAMKKHGNRMRTRCAWMVLLDYRS